MNKKKPEVSGQFLLDAYAETPSIHKLAREFGLSHTTIGGRIKEAGGTLASIGRPQKERFSELTERMAESPWMTRDQLAYSVGITVWRTSKIINEEKGNFFSFRKWVIETHWERKMSVNSAAPPHAHSQSSPD